MAEVAKYCHAAAAVVYVSVIGHLLIAKDPISKIHNDRGGKRNTQQGNTLQRRYLPYTLIKPLNFD